MASRGGRRSCGIPARTCTCTESATRVPGAKWAMSPSASRRPNAPSRWPSISGARWGSGRRANPPSAFAASKRYRDPQEASMMTFRRIATPFALMAALLAFAAVAADRRETRPVTGFTGIALSAPINVELVQGDIESLVLEGDEAELAEIETVVEQGVLKIGAK